MSERIESLKHSVEHKEQQVQKLQETIKAQKEQIRELENAEILSNLNSLSAQGYPVKRIIAAIHDRDTEALVRLVDGNGSAEESGISSASLNNKED